jgi:hypothetical protein
MIKKATIKTLEMLGAVIAVIAILIGAAIWRVASGPITFDEFSPYLVQALSDQEHGISAEIPATLLVWDSNEREFRFRVSGARLLDASGSELAKLPDMSMRLSLLSLFVGRIAPADIHFERPHITLERTGGGKLLFGGISKSPEQTAGGKDFADILKEFLGIKTGLYSGLAILSSMSVDNAKIFIHDQATNKTWEILFPSISFSRDHRGVYGTAQVEITQGENASLLNVNVAYDEDQERLSVTGRFADLNLAFLGGRDAALHDLQRVDLPLTGEIMVAFNHKLEPVAALWDLAGKAGQLKLPEVWPDVMSVKSLTTTGGFDKVERTGAINKFRLELDEPVIELDGKLQPDNTKENGFAFSIQAALANLPMDRLGFYWPPQVAPNPRAWITSNMTVGRFSKLAGTFNGSGAWGDWENISLVGATGTMAMENATIRYHEKLQPVVNVVGEADYDQDAIRIGIRSGRAGDIALSPSPVVISGLRAEDQYIDITVAAKASLPALLQLIDQEPLSYARAVGLDPAKVKGGADVKVQFVFPLLKSLGMEQIKISGTGRATEFNSDELLPGRSISGGNVDVKLDNSQFTASGNVKVNGVPLEVSWQENFTVGGQTPAVRKIGEVSGQITGEQWQLLDTGLYQYLQGPSDLKMNYTEQATGTRQANVMLDATKAAINYNDLNYVKPAGKPFRLTADLAMEPEVEGRITALRVEGDRVDISGSGTFDAASMNLRSLNLSPFILGRNQAVLDYTADTAGAQKFSIVGKALDIGGEAQTKKTSEAARVTPKQKHPLEVRIKVNTLHTGALTKLTDVALLARRDDIGWYNFDVQALAENKVPLSMWMRSEGQIIRLSIMTDDLGAILRSWNVTESVRGGKLLVEGKGTPEKPRVISGKILLENYRVKDMPFLAVLINAVSVVGLADLLKGDGLNFDKLDGKFVLDGDNLLLDDVRTAGGGSLGLNMEGAIDLYTTQTHLQGTVVPFDFFNRVIGSIPLIGDLITGGSGGGLIAAAYSAKGTLSNLDVNVNPASMLTPGIFRQLFFMESIETPNDKPRDLPPAQVLPRGKLQNK